MYEGFPTVEQRRCFEDLLAYLRDELEARKDPEAVEQRARMFAALAGEAGKARVLRDQRLAEEGFVYLSEEGKQRLKHIAELTWLDVPAILAEMEKTAAVSGEYVESDGTVYVIEYGGRKLITADPGNPSTPLRARWRELEGRVATAVGSIAGPLAGSLRPSPAKKNLYSRRGPDRNPSLLLF